MGLDAAEIGLEEGRGAQEESGRVLLDEVADALGVERIVMVDDPETADRGEEQGRGEAEGVEEGESP